MVIQGLNSITNQAYVTDSGHPSSWMGYQLATVIYSSDWWVRTLSFTLEVKEDQKAAPDILGGVM